MPTTAGSPSASSSTTGWRTRSLLDCAPPPSGHTGSTSATTSRPSSGTCGCGTSDRATSLRSYATVAQGKPGKPGPGPASVRRVHATLRSALSSAQRQQLVAFNAAANLDLPAAARPKVRPWEPAELGRFLDSLGDDRLAALFELIAATGLRRGEACGLRWSDVDLGRGVARRPTAARASQRPDEHMPKCTSLR